MCSGDFDGGSGWDESCLLLAFCFFHVLWAGGDYREKVDGRIDWCGTMSVSPSCCFLDV